MIASEEAIVTTEPEELDAEQEQRREDYARSYEAQRRAARDSTFMAKLRAKLAHLDRTRPAGAKHPGT